MTKTNKYKVTRRRILIAIAFLLAAGIGGSVYFLVQEEHSHARHSMLPPVGKKAAPTLTTQPSPQPLFFDDFVDKSKGWYLGSVSGYTRVIANNMLTLADSNHKILTETLPSTTPFEDFTITVTFTLLQAGQGDSVGLYMRGDSNLDHDYRIDIYGDTMYAISKESLDLNESPQVQSLVSPTRAASLKAVGQQNTVTAMMKGPELVLLINGIMVNSVTDTDYASGQIALFVQNSETSSGVEAAFSRVVVSPAPG